MMGGWEARLSGAAIAALMLLPSTPVAAQRQEVTLEASVLRGAVGYARHTAPRTLIGIEIGFGFPQIDRTLTPRKDDETGEPDFEEYLHIGLFVRHRIGSRFDVDTGLRGSIADLWSCSSSDCWPALFGGAYIQPMLGWDRVKLGMRLTAGWIGEVQEGTSGSNSFVASLNPLIVRATLPW
jgi:hypothetical protein